MPRLRLPRISIASLRSRVPSDERLVSLALVAGFVVVIGFIATFVLIAGANVGERTAVKVPAIPAITNVDEPATTTTERPPPPVIGSARPTVSQEAVVQPAPKPKPKPKPTPKPQPPAPPAPPTDNPPQPPDPGPGGPPKADPWDHCAPEGAHAVTKHRHIPLVCHDGRWHFVDFGGR